MSRGRFLAVAWGVALAAGAVLLLRGSEDPWWHDFGSEAWPFYENLLRGDWHAGMAAGPAYKTGALLKLPLALIADAFGGKDVAVFRMIAIPSLIALAWLAVWLAGEARRHVGDRAAAWMALAVVAASPIAYYTYLYGHPEDVLAAAACIAAVLAALRGRAATAGLLLGLAFLNKQWALVAVFPILLVLPARRLVFCACAALVGSLIAVPMLVAAPGGVAAQVGATSDLFFHPQQVWWPLGEPASADFIAGGHGSKEGPAWLGPFPKPLIVALQIPLGLWWLRAGGRARRREDVLGLLALILLARCALDPWNLVYYHLPLVLALAAWEVVALRRTPWLALVVTAATLFSFELYTAREGYGPFLAYFAWVIPLAAHLVRRVVLGSAPAPSRAASARPASLASART